MIELSIAVLAALYTARLLMSEARRPRAAFAGAVWSVAGDPPGGFGRPTTTGEGSSSGEDAAPPAVEGEADTRSLLDPPEARNGHAVLPTSTVSAGDAAATPEDRADAPDPGEASGEQPGAEPAAAATAAEAAPAEVANAEVANAEPREHAPTDLANAQSREEAPADLPTEPRADAQPDVANAEPPAESDDAGAATQPAADEHAQPSLLVTGGDPSAVAVPSPTAEPKGDGQAQADQRTAAPEVAGRAQPEQPALDLGSTAEPNATVLPPPTASVAGSEPERTTPDTSLDAQPSSALPAVDSPPLETVPVEPPAAFAPSFDVAPTIETLDLDPAPVVTDVPLRRTRKRARVGTEAPMLHEEYVRVGPLVRVLAVLRLIGAIALFGTMFALALIGIGRGIALLFS